MIEEWIVLTKAAPGRSGDGCVYYGTREECEARAASAHLRGEAVEQLGPSGRGGRRDVSKEEGAISVAVRRRARLVGA